MQLPIKAHYAALAMLELARRHHLAGAVPARTVAEQHGIPIQFLGQILQQLRAAGLITSLRGSGGGFNLSRSPDQITLADVVEAVGCGPSQEPPQAGAGPLGEVVFQVWRDLAELQQEHLRQFTLQELLHRAASDTAMMFYI